jgi:hypothetical protein
MAFVGYLLLTRESGDPRGKLWHIAPSSIFHSFLPSFLPSKQNKTKQNKNGFRYASNVPNACCELSFWEIINDDF